MKRPSQQILWRVVLATSLSLPPSLSLPSLSPLLLVDRCRPRHVDFALSLSKRMRTHDAQRSRPSACFLARSVHNATRVKSASTKIGIMRLHNSTIKLEATVEPLACREKQRMRAKSSGQKKLHLRHPFQYRRKTYHAATHILNQGCTIRNHCPNEDPMNFHGLGDLNLGRVVCRALSHSAKGVSQITPWFRSLCYVIHPMLMLILLCFFAFPLTSVAECVHPSAK